ncbi:MAG: energy transducer TonB [Parafilimonas sp.]|nr:energy transducer TonB [Parafilimonas sp.]
MLPDTIMQSDLLDILFENRNKTYGAYALRRSYNKTLAAAISTTFFIAIIFSVFQFMHHTKQTDHITPVFISDPILTKLDAVKPVKPLQHQQQRAPQRLNQVVTSAPKIVDDFQPTKMPTVDDALNNIIGSETAAGRQTGDIVQPTEGTGEGKAANAPVAETKPDDKPLEWAQVMPQYPGGIDALRKFMLKNLREPDDLQSGEKIVVSASFVVNKNGEIEQVKIINSGRPDLDKEVQRVINKMPLWKPGMQNGNTVSVYFNLPVTFMSAEEN